MYLKDGINFASKWNGVRFANALRLTLSYYQSKYAKRNLHRGMPFSVSFEPTTACNLRCPECPSGLRAFSRPTGMLSADLFCRTIDEISPQLLYLLFYFQGEPYLHPKFYDLVRYAADKNLYTATSTNAHFLTEEAARMTVESGLDRLIISIDGTTQQTYQAYRIGGKLEKVIAGTKNMVSWRRKLKSNRPQLIFQFLVVRPNEHQIAQVRKLAKKLGVDAVSLKSAQIYDYKNGSPLMPRQPKYSRYQQQPNGTYAIKNRLANHCWKMWHSAVITWDGQVVPCCFDKDARHKMGTLKTHTFKEIWRGDAYQDFRQQLLCARKHVKMCQNCTEGTKIWR